MNPLLPESCRCLITNTQDLTHKSRVVLVVCSAIRFTLSSIFQRNRWCSMLGMIDDFDLVKNICKIHESDPIQLSASQQISGHTTSRGKQPRTWYVLDIYMYSQRQHYASSRGMRKLARAQPTFSSRSLHSSKQSSPSSTWSGSFSWTLGCPAS